MRGWEACWLESWLAWLFSRCWTNEVLPVPGGGWRGGQHTQGGYMHDIAQLHVHGGLQACTQLHIHPCTLLPITCAQEMDRDKQTDRQADRQAGRQAGRQTGRQTDRQAGRQVGRQADRQAGRHAHRQGCRQTGRQVGRPG